jgi:phenylalanyl-tRNA synthetase beta chain
VGRGISDVVMFEVGRVFRPRPGQQVVTPRLPVDRRPTEDELAALEAGLPDQPRRLCLVVCGKTERDGWWGPGREAQWLEAIAAARMAARAIDAPLDVRAARQDPWHPGRCAALVIDDQVIGYAGELHPRAVAALGLPGRVGAVELDIDLLSAYAQPIVPAPRVSTFPPAREDLAFVVAADVPAAALEQAIRSGAGELLENVWLFDVYEGPQVGDGRKSLAYTVTLRAADHTLTVDELAAARAAIVSSAAQEVGAVLRGG